MNKNNTLFNRLNVWKNRTRRLLNELSLANFDFTDADGSILFSTDGEDDTLSIGMSVIIPDGSTDGTFTLSDGTVVIVADGSISDIQQPDQANDPASSAQLQVQNQALRNQLAQARQLVNELQSKVVGLSNQVTSNYSAPTRIHPIGKDSVAKSREERHNEIIEKRNKLRGGK